MAVVDAELVREAKERLLAGLPLSTGHVAQLAGCHPHTVTSWIKSGKIDGVKGPGGHHLVPASEVREKILGIVPEPA